MGSSSLRWQRVRYDSKLWFTDGGETSIVSTLLDFKSVLVTLSCPLGVQVLSISLRNAEVEAIALDVRQIKIVTNNGTGVHAF